MTILVSLFFGAVLAAAIWAMIATIAPRAHYIAALLSGSAAAPVLVPVAQRRQVRRVTAFPIRPAARMLPAAA